MKASKSKARTEAVNGDLQRRERLHEELGDLPTAEYEELNINEDNSRTLAAT